MGCAAMGLHKSIVGIGVDVERVSDRFLRVCPRISNQADGDQVFRSGIVQDEAEGAALIWVIKEACFKAALDQDNLFGYNQLIKKIERTSTLADMRWRGQVISGKGDSKEKWEFEAGCLAHGVDHEGSKPGDGNLSSIMPWIWAVAWANG
jgi:4'-phosphopantetheinyl transferase EntD